jgi:hypothetical protein
VARISVVIEKYGFPEEARKTIIAHIRADIRRGRAIALLPRHHVYLHVDDGDGARFARLFGEAWQRLPKWARDPILRYWREDQSGLMAHSPEIRLARRWDRQGRREYARVTRCGHQMWFGSDAVASMPDEVAQDLIAHELAHVVQGVQGIRCTKETSRGRATYAYPDGSYFGTRIESEEAADEMMGRWGFDPWSSNRWSLETGRSKIIEIEDTPAARKRYLARRERYGR